MSKKAVVYDFLLNENSKDYTIRKTIEELNELSLILIQSLNKQKETDEEKIIEEIGDVEIRMKVLKQMFSKEKIRARIAFKINKFYKYIIEKKYKQI